MAGEVDKIYAELNKQNSYLENLIDENARLQKFLYEKLPINKIEETLAKRNEELDKVINAINSDLGKSINKKTLSKDLEELRLEVEKTRDEFSLLSKSDTDYKDKKDKLKELSRAYDLLNSASQNYYSSAIDYQKELNKRHREGVTVFHDWQERFNQRTEFLKKGIGEIKSGLTQAYGALKDGLEPWAKANQEAMTYAKTIGMSKNTAKAFLDSTVTWAADNDIGRLFNKSTDELIKLQTKYSDVLGRNVLLSGEQTKDMLALEAILGEDTMTDLTNNLENFGLGVSDTADFVHKTMNEATKYGISASKLTKTIRENIKMAQNYTFKNGLEGLSSMAKKAIELKTDLSLVNSFLEKTSTVEGAITTGANLQVLGGTYAMGSDPLSMMYESLSDMEGLFDRAVSMAKGKVFFNQATGNFDMGAQDRYMMKQAATVMGIDPSKMIDVAFRQASLGRIENAINLNKNIGVANDEDMVRLIKNTATFKNGEAFVNIDGKDTNVKDLTKEDKTKLEALSRNDTENLQAMAIDLRSINEKMGGLGKEVNNEQASIVAPIGNKIDKLLTEQGEFFSNFATTAAYIKTIMAGISVTGGLISTFLGVARVSWGTLIGIGRALNLGKGGAGAVSSAASSAAGATGTGGKFKNWWKTKGVTGVKGGAAMGAIGAGITIASDIASGDFEKDKGSTLIEAGAQLAGGVLGGALGSFLGPMGTMVGASIGTELGRVAGEAINGTIKKGADETRKEIADEMARHSGKFKELFVGENALKGNYSKAQLNEIKEAIKDNVLSKDEVGWMDFAEIESNGDFETLAKAGVSVRMASGGVINGGKLYGKSHSEGGMPILGSNISVEGGEYVVNKQATEKNLPLLEKINHGDYEFTAIEPLGKQMKVHQNTNSLGSSMPHNSKIDIPPISINLSGTIKLDTGNSTVDVSKNILTNPELISKLTNMIAKQLNVIDNGSYNKGYFKQKFI